MNTIGGLVATDRNIIVGNAAIKPIGIEITDAGTEANFVEGNLIGTNAAGSTGLGNATGVLIKGGASGNLIGGTAPGAENLISGNAGDGIEISGTGTTGNSIFGNGIGTDPTGTLALPNSAGVKIDSGASKNLLGTNGDGSADAQERNVISGNNGDGIEISGSGTTGNVVAGNYIGTDYTGTLAIANSIGVLLDTGTPRTRIGTNGDGVGDAAEGNLISGNTSDGLAIANPGTNSNVVAGNLIGTNAAGTAAVPNSTLGTANGLLIANQAAFNRIGTNGDGVSDDLERNVISGNLGFAGLIIQDSNNNIVAGNYIGTDKTGTVALPNPDGGIEIKAGSLGNLIGTKGDGSHDDAERNVVSANGLRGIEIDGSGTSLNVVAGNYVGPDKTGAIALGNQPTGILIATAAQTNVIGVSTLFGAENADQGNLISGNTTDGVRNHRRRNDRQHRGR